MDRERVLDQLRKIKRLADEGQDGEAWAASHILADRLTKLGLTIEDVMGNTTTVHEFTYASAQEKQLIFQVLGKVAPECEHFCQYKGQKKISFELTAAQSVDMEMYLEHYRHVLRREWRVFKEHFMQAFVAKHRLGRDDGEAAEIGEDELRAIMGMMSAMKHDSGPQRRLTMEEVA